VKEPLPIGHFARRVILQRGARHLPNVDRNPAQRLADRNRHPRRHGLPGKLPQSLHQDRLITQRFLRRRIGPLAVVVLRKPEQAVGGGDDVLDLGAGAGFKNWKRVDEDRLVRNELAGLLQLARAARAPTSAFMTGFVTSSTVGGSGGSAL
jgi:nucleoside-diphosphate-sugar epimerase